MISESQFYQEQLNITKDLYKKDESKHIPVVFKPEKDQTGIYKIDKPQSNHPAIDSEVIGLKYGEDIKITNFDWTEYTLIFYLPSK